MNISELISTQERERILRKMLYTSNQLSLHQMAREANVSPAQVHKYLSILKKYNLVEKNSLRSDPLIIALRIAENMLFLKNARLVDTLRKSMDTTSIGIYGSWSKGTNDETADVDIWIMVSSMPDDLTIGKTRRELEKRLKRKIDIIVLTNEKLKDLKNNNPTFYFSIYHSILLWGKHI